MEIYLGKMFWGALALSVGFLLTTSRVVHAGSVTSGLYLAGVSTSLLILQNGVLVADAALSKLRKFCRRGARTEEDEESEALLPDEPAEVTLPTNVRRAYSDVIGVWSGVLPPVDNSGFVRHIREMSHLRNDYGEKAVRAVLRWRKPGPDRPHPLDEIFPAGGEMKLYSRYNKRHHNISRLARGGTKLPVFNVIYPILGGNVSVHMVELPEDMLKDPEALEAALRLVHQRVSPPVVGDSPAKRQKDLGVLAILDILTIPGKTTVVPGVHSHDKIFFNMFLVTSPVKGSLLELLLDLENCSSDDESKHIVRRAKLSVTVQLFTIFHKLRDAGLVPPPVTTGSFVLNSAGRVFLSDFAPLLLRNKRYVKLPSGLIVPEKKAKRFTGSKRATPHWINDTQVINDLLSIIFEMWCRPRCSGGPSDTTTPTIASSVDDGGAPGSDSEEGAAAGGATKGDSGEGAAAGGATGGDSEEGAAAAAAPSLTLEDFDCEGMPRPLLKIVEMLLDPFDIELGRIITHREFLNLMALARGEASDT